MLRVTYNWLHRTALLFVSRSNYATLGIVLLMVEGLVRLVNTILVTGVYRSGVRGPILTRDVLAWANQLTVNQTPHQYFTADREHFHCSVRR
jgi:hypothetical protein